jgi:hypothetical protein
MFHAIDTAMESESGIDHHDLTGYDLACTALDALAEEVMKKNIDYH